MGSNDEAIAEFGKQLGLDKTAWPDLLTAFTHRSLVEPQDSYERLEFVGDRVVGLIVADYLYEHFPDEDEGKLARRHTALVRRETLADIAQDLSFGDFLALSEGEDSAGGRRNPAILSDAVEAVMAVLFMHRGMKHARNFLLPYLEARINDAAPPPRDPKTALQEWAQARKLGLPSYTEVSRAGPDHAPIFTVEVQVKGVPSVRAEGRSKRLAESKAAEDMLRNVSGGADSAELTDVVRVKPMEEPGS